MIIADIIGIIGVIIILIAYMALQLEKLSAKKLLYSAMNAIGAAFILISLIFSFNLASFIIEIAWLVISIFGMFRALKTR